MSGWLFLSTARSCLRFLVSISTEPPRLELKSPQDCEQTHIQVALWPSLSGSVPHVTTLGSPEVAAMALHPDSYPVPFTTYDPTLSTPNPEVKPCFLPGRADRPLQEAHGVGMPGGALSAACGEELRVGPTDAAHLLPVLLAVCLLHGAQWHGIRDRVHVPLLLAQWTEQDLAGWLGPHPGGQDEAQLAEGVSAGGCHCVLWESLTGRTGGLFIRRGRGYHGAFPSLSNEASASGRTNALS